MKGELIGINSQIMSPSGGNIGIGFAIPSNMAGHVMTLCAPTATCVARSSACPCSRVTSDLAASLNLKNVSGAIVSGVTQRQPRRRGRD